MRGSRPLNQSPIFLNETVLFTRLLWDFFRGKGPALHNGGHGRFLRKSGKLHSALRGENYCLPGNFVNTAAARQPLAEHFQELDFSPAIQFTTSAPLDQLFESPVRSLTNTLHMISVMKCYSCRVSSIKSKELVTEIDVLWYRHPNLPVIWALPRQ